MPFYRTCFGSLVLIAFAMGCASHNGSKTIPPSGAARHTMTVPAANYDTAVLSLSPYAYYRLDETSGTVAADSSGNGRNGTYIGTSGTHYLLGQANIVPGLTHSVKLFAANPGGPKVSLPSMNLASNGTTWVSDFTVSAWMKPDPSQLAQAVAAGEINDYYLGQGGAAGSATTTPYMGSYPSGNSWSAATTFADGNAHLLTMTVHRNTSGTCDMTLYADGALTKSTPGTTCTGHSSIVYSTNAGIGGRISYSAGAGPYFGEMGGFAVFATALTPAQISYLYTGTASPTPSPTPSPVPGTYDATVMSYAPYAYYRLDETSGTVAIDSSGNGRNGTYIGTSGTHYLLGQTSIVPGLAYSAKLFAANPGGPKVSLPSVNLASNGTSWVSDFTVSAWTKPDPSQLAQAVAAGEINDYYIGQGGANGSATTNAYMGSYPSGNSWSSATTFADGNAHLLTMTVQRNGSGTCDMTLYADGALAKSTPGTACTGHASVVYSTNAGIGGRVSYSAGAGPYFGEIGGFAIFSRVLSAAEIANLFSGATPTPSPSPTPTPTPTLPPAAVTSYSLGGAPTSFAELADGRVIASIGNAANSTSTIVLLDPATGTVTTLDSLTNVTGGSAVAGTDGQVWFGFGQPQPALSGPLIKRYSATGANVSVTLAYHQSFFIESAADQRLFVTGNDGTGAGGCMLDTIDTSGAVVSYPSPALCADRVIRGSDNGLWTLGAATLVRYSSADFSSTSYAIPANVGPNQAVNLGGVSGSYLGLVDFNRLSTQAVDNVATSGTAGPYVLVPSGLQAEAFGPDGTYWIMPSATQICRLNRTTGATACIDRGTVPQPSMFQAGSRNRMWFVSGNGLYKIDVSALPPAP
jgi:hypothetical protein